MLAFIAQAVSAADSSAIVSAVGRALDSVFNGLDPTVRLFLIGPLVFIAMQGWKWVMDPKTPPLSKLSAWWEINRNWANVILPALLAWLANGHRIDLVGLLSMFSPAMVHGIKTAVVSSVTARPTAAGQKTITIAAAFLLASVLLASSAHAGALSTAFVARFKPTVTVGAVERWEGFRRFEGQLPSPRLVLQPGLNWNDQWALRGRIEWGMDRTGPLGSERHPWSGELGVHYLLWPR